jgi:hypothetical protein
MEQRQIVGPLPVAVCAAVEEFVAQVDSAEGLDDQGARTQVNEAFRNLNGILTAHQAQANVIPVRTKSMAFSLATLGQRGAATAPSGAQQLARAAGDPQRLRQELLGMCGK